MSQSLGRCEALSLTIADVGFGRLHIGRQAPPPTPLAEMLTMPSPQPVAPFILQKLLDDTLGFAVFAFSEMVITNSSFAIDEVKRAASIGC